MTYQELIDLEDSEIFDLGTASEETEGVSGSPGEGGGVNSSVG